VFRLATWKFSRREGRQKGRGREYVETLVENGKKRAKLHAHQRNFGSEGRGILLDLMNEKGKGGKKELRGGEGGNAVAGHEGIVKEEERGKTTQMATCVGGERKQSSIILGLETARSAAIARNNQLTGRGKEGRELLTRVTRLAKGGNGEREGEYDKEEEIRLGGRKGER